MRFGADPELDRFVGDQVAERRVTVIVIGHVANKMRQLVAGVDALEMVGTVDVVGAVNQPVGIKTMMVSTPSSRHRLPISLCPSMAPWRQPWFYPAVQRDT